MAIPGSTRFREGADAYDQVGRGDVLPYLAGFQVERIVTVMLLPLIKLTSRGVMPTICKISNQAGFPGLECCGGRKYQGCIGLRSVNDRSRFSAQDSLGCLDLLIWVMVWVTIFLTLPAWNYGRRCCKHPD